MRRFLGDCPPACVSLQPSGRRRVRLVAPRLLLRLPARAQSPLSLLPPGGALRAPAGSRGSCPSGREHLLPGVCLGVWGGGWLPGVSKGTACIVAVAGVSGAGSSPSVQSQTGCRVVSLPRPSTWGTPMYDLGCFTLEPAAVYPTSKQGLRGKPESRSSRPRALVTPRLRKEPQSWASKCQLKAAVPTAGEHDSNYMPGGAPWIDSWPQEALGKQGSGPRSASHLLTHDVEPVLPVSALGLAFLMVMVEPPAGPQGSLPCLLLSLVRVRQAAHPCKTG